MNKDIMCEFIERANDSTSGLSDALGLSIRELTERINSGDFSLEEIEIIRSRYRLSADEVDLFFNYG